MRGAGGAASSRHLTLSRSQVFPLHSQRVAANNNSERPELLAFPLTENPSENQVESWSPTEV